MLDISLSWYLARSPHFASSLDLFSVKVTSSRSLRFFWFLQASLRPSHPQTLVSQCFANLGGLSLLWKLNSYPVPRPLTPVPKLLSPCPLESGCCSGLGPEEAGGSLGPQDDSLTGLCLSRCIPLQLCHIWSAYGSWASSSGRCRICGGLCEPTHRVCDPSPAQKDAGDGDA